MSVPRGLWLAVGLGMITCVEGDLEAWISLRWQQGCWDMGTQPKKRGDWAFDATLSLRLNGATLASTATGCMFNENANDLTVDSDGKPIYGVEQRFLDSDSSPAYVTKPYVGEGTQVCIYYKAKEDDGIGQLGCDDGGALGNDRPLMAQCRAEKTCCETVTKLGSGEFNCTGQGNGGAGTVATVTWRWPAERPSLAPTRSPTSPTEVPTPAPPVATIDVPEGFIAGERFLQSDEANINQDSFYAVLDQFATSWVPGADQSYGPDQGYGPGIADFWWVNRSMRGATFWDIIPNMDDGFGNFGFGQAKTPTVFPINSSFTIHCASTSCDVFVFIYHDPPRSSTTNGGLISLVDDGWEASSCAPAFRLAKYGTGPFAKRMPLANPTENAYQECVYHMVAMRNTIGNGESVTVKMEERRGAFIFFAVVPKAVCGNTMTEAECNATHTDDGPVSTCAFVDDACIDNWCARRHTTRPPDFTRPPTINCPAANEGL